MTGQRPTRRRRPLGLVVTALVVGTVACSDDPAETGSEPDPGGGGQGGRVTATTTPDDSNGTITFDVADEPTGPTTTPAADSTSSPVDTGATRPVGVEVAASGTLSADEIAGLYWMREEEQLAHDVYVVLGDRWDVPIFANIAESEVTHIASVVEVLDQLDLDDPAAGNPLGTFTDPAMQEIYDEMVDRGTTSLVAALEVGASIEEMDIVDLRTRSAQTDEREIIDLYRRLERGSSNHLRAFAAQLDNRDIVYEPSRLEADDYAAIVSARRGRRGSARGSGGPAAPPGRG